MSKWLPVFEADTAAGEHTCYSRKIRDKEFIWVTLQPNGSWNVKVSSDEEGADFITVAKSRSLRGAKQRARRFINDILHSAL